MGKQKERDKWRESEKEGIKMKEKISKERNVISEKKTKKKINIP